MSCNRDKPLLIIGWLSNWYYGNIELKHGCGYYDFTGLGFATFSYKQSWWILGSYRSICGITSPWYHQVASQIQECASAPTSRAMAAIAPPSHTFPTNLLYAQIRPSCLPTLLGFLPCPWAFHSMPSHCAPETNQEKSLFKHCLTIISLLAENMVKKYWIITDQSCRTSVLGYNLTLQYPCANPTVPLKPIFCAIMELALIHTISPVCLDCNFTNLLSRKIQLYKIKVVRQLNQTLWPVNSAKEQCKETPLTCKQGPV